MGSEWSSRGSPGACSLVCGVDKWRKNGGRGRAGSLRRMLTMGLLSEKGLLCLCPLLPWPAMSCRIRWWQRESQWCGSQGCLGLGGPRREVQGNLSPPRCWGWGAAPTGKMWSESARSPGIEDLKKGVSPALVISTSSVG